VFVLNRSILDELNTIKQILFVFIFHIYYPYLFSRVPMLLPTFPLLFIDSYLCIVPVHTQTRAHYKINLPIMCSAIGKYLR
jgi:hypothetical protein